MKKFFILTILAIFVIPLCSIIPIREQPIWYGQYLGLLFMFFLGMSFVIWDFNKYLSLFTILCLLSTFFVTRLAPRSIILLFHLDIGCLCAYGVSRFNQIQRKYILYAILGLTILQVTLMILQSFNIDPIFKSLQRQGFDEIVGLNGAPNQLGAYFALTAPTLSYFNPLLIILSLMGFILAHSSFAYIAGIIALMIYLFYNSRELFIGLLVILILFTPLFLGEVDKLRKIDIDTRFHVWNYAIKAVNKGSIDIEKNRQSWRITTKPYIGYGFGNFLSIFPYVPEKNTGSNFNYATEKFTHAHNDYIESFFELSYIGIGLILLLIINFIYNFIIFSPKSKELVLYFSSIVAYLLNASGNFISQLAVSGMLLILFYGMYKGTERELNAIS